MSQIGAVSLRGLYSTWKIILGTIILIVVFLAVLPDPVLRDESMLFAASASGAVPVSNMETKRLRSDGVYIPRILFVLSTYEKAYETRIQKIYETWGKRVIENPEYMEFLLIGIDGEKEIPKMKQARCPPGYWEGM